MNSKMALVALVSTLAVASLAAPQMGTMTDPRDGKTYKTVKIGDQVWMAENLNYKTTYSKCYDDNQQNCTKYGRLYGRQSVSQACPNGWHLPESLEFIILFNEFDLRTFKQSVGKKKDTLDFVENAGNYLKSTTGWNNNGNGSNLAGFSAIPGGNIALNRVLNTDRFHGLGEMAFFWTSDYVYVQETHETPLLNVIFALAKAANDGVFYKDRIGGGYAGGGFSVRCIKDDKKGKEKLDSLRKEMTK